ncbi:hypothetical protein AVEN_138083-1 [Araneus ventricosus]|uniref:Mos1 transposase HTH domain-containing protein n=1 Tax=Araneus ventricosus TaxID=182803 RepID=A0A4Y2J223_ARAVE|nr:hypothetical protein AVEN_138083-1 [Araneus ventricosus]
MSGRPPTSTTPDNIERVRRMLADDRRLSLRMIAEELKISLDSVSNIIHEHLQKRKKKLQKIWFQHDGEPAHKTSSVNQYLVEEFGEQIIGYGGFQERPPRSPDLTPIDIFMW